MRRFVIKQDIYKDAWNWWSGCNRHSHGVDWKEKIPQAIADQLVGSEEQSAYLFLIPLLKEKYQSEQLLFRKYLDGTNAKFKHDLEPACEILASLMGKQIYRDDFTFFLTTFPRSPYSKDKGYIWLSVYRKDPLRTFLHELCHFQFLHYWREAKLNSVSSLGKEEFEFLKESLTVIITREFFPMIESDDGGYKLHQDFRLLLKEYWRENQDFDALVSFGVSKLDDYINKSQKV